LEDFRMGKHMGNITSYNIDQFFDLILCIPLGRPSI